MPDLRTSSALSHAAAWKSVVIDGALEEQGMASFRDYVSPQQAEAIRGYISGQAKLLEGQQALAPGAPAAGH